MKRKEAVRENPGKLPSGVPKEVWDEVMKRQEEYIAQWKAEIIRHMSNYDRTIASQKAKTKAKAKVKRSNPKSR